MCRGGRRTTERHARETVLIVCEGQATERNYFDRLRREETVTDRLSVTVRSAHGGSPEAIVREAILYKEQYGEQGDDFGRVFCVIDVERDRSSLARARKLAQDGDIELVLSNPSFEVWLLAHYERSSRPFTGAKEVRAAFNRHWVKHHGRKYHKGDEDIYGRLARLRRTAIANAKHVRERNFGGMADTADANSSTEVYRLVEYLVGSS